MSEHFTGVAGLPPGMPAGLTPGSRLASYYLEDRIGAGGMAVVYRAYDERLRRRVALKVMSPAAAPDADFRQRFVLEAQAAAAVDDPHIIPVYEAGEENGILFIAMRYVPAGDVRSLVLRGGPLAPPHALAILSGVASALDAAHAAGLVHRDVKPANMLLDVRPGRPDHVYLSDFGLTKGTMATHGITASGQFLGTPDYSAPEQMQARPTDGRADQYSLACAAFELLTGAPPYPREQVTAVIWAHMSEAPPPLASRVHGLPAAADTVLARALAKAPGDRYETCRAFTDALRAVLGLEPYSSGSGGQPPTPPPGLSTGNSARHQARPGQSRAGLAQPSGPAHRSTTHGARPGVAPDAGRRRLLLGGAAAAAVAAVGGIAWGLDEAARRRGAGAGSGLAGSGARAGGAQADGAPPGGAGAGAARALWLTPMTSGAAAHWLAVIPGGASVYLRGEYQLDALRADSGKHRWTFTVHGGDRLLTSAAATREAVYVCDLTTGSAGQIRAFSPADGTPLWTAPVLAEGIAVAGGRVFACGEQDDLTGLFALDAATGKQVWRFPATTLGTPAVSGGLVYAVGNPDSAYRLYAVRAGAGGLAWSAPTGSASYGGLAVSGGFVSAVSEESGTLAVWRAGDGQRLWGTDAGDGVESATVAGAIVYAVTKDGELLALDASRGSKLWSRPSSEVVAPVVAGGLVYASSPGYGLAAYRARTGQLAWHAPHGYFTTTPAVAGGVVYAASTAGVYALLA